MPCKIISPIVDELAEEMDGVMDFAKVDVDSSPITAVTYGIRSIPALLIFKGGKPVEQIVGAIPKNQLKKKIEAGLSRLTGLLQSSNIREWMGPGGSRGLQIRCIPSQPGWEGSTPPAPANWQTSNNGVPRQGAIPKEIQRQGVGPTNNSPIKIPRHHKTQ